RCLKLSSAFGGANAALVLGKASGPAEAATRASRPVFVRAIGAPVTDPESVDVVSARIDSARLARMDSFSLLAVFAAARAIGSEPLAKDAGVVVGTSAATAEINADFERRRVKRGP